MAKSKDPSNLQVDKTSKVTTEEVTKEELIELMEKGAESLLMEKSKDLSNLQVDKTFKVTTEEVTKEELIELMAEGAESLLPIIDAMTIKQLKRVLSILVYAPVMKHPHKEPQNKLEAIMVMNFLRLQDIKIAIVELMDGELELEEYEHENKSDK